MAEKSDLGARMQGYENVQRHYLTRRMPTIIRVDGKAFHSFTRGMGRPFDWRITHTIWNTAMYLCENIQGCRVAYSQSDEISLLLTDYDTLDTQAWFDKNVSKMISVSASMATMAFNYGCILATKRDAMFDSRVFSLPREEVTNYFVWRQQDATRNAIQMVGQAHFSQKQLHGKNCKQIQEMLFRDKSINFNKLPTYLKRGACIVKEVHEKDGAYRTRWVVDEDIPIFTQDRSYIEKYVAIPTDEEVT